MSLTHGSFPHGSCRRAVRISLLGFCGLVLLAMPREAWAGSRSLFEVRTAEISHTSIDAADLAQERATGLPARLVTVEDGRTELSVILWDELKRPGVPRPSGGGQSAIGNFASVANGQPIR